MKILLFTTAHNGLSQRAYSELVERGHVVSIQLAGSETSMEAAAAHFQPQLIIASFLSRAVPASLIDQYTVLALRPGTGSDRGPSSLNGTPSENLQNWRITVLQASAETDEGAIWASKGFGMNPGWNSTYYQHHVAQAAVQSMLEAIEKLESKKFSPKPLQFIDPQLRGRLHRSSQHLC
jgi:putative two-component system protein, hydrogenase maturation factor HypX/HoxX